MPSDARPSSCSRGSLQAFHEINSRYRLAPLWGASLMKAWFLLSVGAVNLSDVGGFHQKAAKPQVQRGSPPESSLLVSWDTVADRSRPRILGQVIPHNEDSSFLGATYLVMCYFLVCTKYNALNGFLRLFQPIDRVYILLVNWSGYTTDHQTMRCHFVRAQRSSIHQ